MQVDTTVLGLSAEDAKASPYIASMGIYVFKKSVLLKLLLDKFPTCNDFGSEVRLDLRSYHHRGSTKQYPDLPRVDESRQNREARLSRAMSWD